MDRVQPQTSEVTGYYFKYSHIYCYPLGVLKWHHALQNFSDLMCSEHEQEILLETLLQYYLVSLSYLGF